MKSPILLMILFFGSTLTQAQIQSLPIDVTKYTPMALPRVETPTTVNTSPVKLLKYNSLTTHVDTINVVAPGSGRDIVYPPSQRLTPESIHPNAFKATGFSALQPADQLQGFPNYPFSTIVKLYVTFINPSTQQQSMFTCSGAMINKEYLITAGHCVYNHDVKNWASDIVVVPAYNMSVSPYGYTKGINPVSFNGWVANQDWNYDMAIIKTTTPIGNTVGWLGWGSNTNNSFFTSSSNIESSIGYPAKDDNQNPVFEQGERMYVWSGYMDYWESANVVCHYNAGYHGQSGSALYYKNASNERYVYGVLNHGDGIKAPIHTCHCRIDNSMASVFANQMPLSTGSSIANDIEIIAYPNPVANQVTVDFGKRQFVSGVVEVWSMTGTMVTRKEAVSGKPLNIDLSNNSSGFYLLIANLDGTRFTGKILKN